MRAWLVVLLLLPCCAALAQQHNYNNLLQAPTEVMALHVPGLRHYPNQDLSYSAAPLLVANKDINYPAGLRWQYLPTTYKARYGICWDIQKEIGHFVRLRLAVNGMQGFTL